MLTEDSFYLGMNGRLRIHRIYFIVLQTLRHNFDDLTRSLTRPRVFDQISQKIFDLPLHFFY